MVRQVLILLQEFLELTSELSDGPSDLHLLLISLPHHLVILRFLFLQLNAVVILVVDVRYFAILVSFLCQFKKKIG